FLADGADPAGLNPVSRVVPGSTGHDSTRSAGSGGEMPEPFKYDGLIMLLSQAGANPLDPLEMEMQRTLPRESQGAVCLNRPFHRRMHGFLNQQLRHQEPRFGTRVGGRHINGGAGVMQGKPRIIQRHAMVRERMLDGL